MRLPFARRLAVALLAVLLVASPSCGGDGDGGGDDHPPIDALALCTGKAAARMYALVGTFDGILRHWNFVGDLPPGVAQVGPDGKTFLFEVFGDDVRADLWSGNDVIDDGYDVGEVAIFTWTLSRGGVPTGEGQLSLVRLSTDRLNVSPSGTASPGFRPDATCSYVLEGLNLFVYFISDPAQMNPGGSNFWGTAAVGGDSLAGMGMVDNAAVATMTGTYLGASYSYTLDLEDGAVTLP